MEIEKPTTHDLRDTLEVEVERDLNLNDSDFEGPTMPREAGGLEDQTGYYEVPCCTCLSYE